ncbi:disulfide bond formation protein B [Rhodoplanes azumiensis]|uniref:Disulfide bond formation protein B n=1 Tax=Rhodoplanes azumiensis TaxID=1897628 RepID=A0ABW5AGS6_9BRAD
MIDVSRLVRPSLVLGVIVVLGIGALGAAFAGERLLGAEPCILCLYQRIPYVVTALLAGSAAALPISAQARIRVIAACGVVFLLGAVLAFYSVGVEEHWWAGIPGCEGELPEGLALDRLQDRTTVWKATRPCDVDVWRLFGLSLAAYNSVLQAVASAGCLIAVRSMNRSLAR